MLDVCYHITQLLLHRQFMQAPTDDLDPAMRDLIKHSHTICTQASANIINLSNQADLRHYISVSPTSLIYAVFQGALIHIYNISKDNLKMQSKFNLQRSMGFLNERRKWRAVSRVIEILKLMTTLNGITDKSIMSLVNDDSAPPEPTPMETSQATATSKKKRRSRTASGTTSTEEHKVIPKVEEPSADIVRNEQFAIPAYLPFNHYVGDEMPKGQWIQRMMNTSVVGGITPDIQSSLGSVLALTQSGSMPRGNSGMGELDNSSAIPSALPEMHMRQHPMTMHSAHPALIPWHNLQMLPQNFSTYPMYAGSAAPAHREGIHPQPAYPYSVPSNQGVSDKPGFQQQHQQRQNGQTATIPGMYQEHHQSLQGSSSRQRDDMTLLPPGSLNWEDWNTYVDQETNRNQ